MNKAALSLSQPITRQRHRLTIRGVVQGVGFRPFVYRLAHELSLSGWVTNIRQGTVLEIEGDALNLEKFRERLQTEAPSAARIQEVSCLPLPQEGSQAFFIRTSHQAGPKHSVPSPDLATCLECIREIFDPLSRRHRYPFTTCTQCGPRWSIIQDIPYDRANTTMKTFRLCGECQVEYDNMADRRFHAEAMACPVCGPHVSLWDQHGHVLAEKEDAVQQACEILQRKGILAVKGLGGFQFWVDASSEEAVQRLRDRKQRPRKPLAVLFPSLESVQDDCLVSLEEETVLTSSESPIVLLRRKEMCSLASAVAPSHPYVGAMFPYTPLHHLLMADLQFPVVATSGNRSEEPIVIDEQEALIRLNGIADAFLVHDRPIVRPVDDSVVRLVNGDILLLRRARGYAPKSMVVNIPGSQGKRHSPILGVGGHLKNTVAVTMGGQIVTSQHIGDLSTAESTAQFERTVYDQLKLFDLNLIAVACDLHPGYRSTIFAQRLGKKLNVPIIPVQHHHAHISSCMAEHVLEGPVLGVAWDGAGYGYDGTIWGGEFVVADFSGFKRIAHLRPFRLPGSEKAMREPCRVALAILYEAFGEEALALNLPALTSLSPDLARSFVSMIQKSVASPVTTSLGRLFDGISAILGLCQVATFEGEAAMAVEFSAETTQNDQQNRGYPLPLTEKEGKNEPLIADWRPLVKAIVQDVEVGGKPGTIARRFHHALADLIVRVAERVGLSQVVLTGGVFQNALLLQLARTSLRNSGFQVYSHHQFPPNDGGLALGQVMVAAQLLNRSQESVSRIKN